MSMQLRMITVSETITTTVRVNFVDEVSKSTGEHAYVTDMSVVEFVRRLNLAIEDTCARYSNLDRRGWWHIISVVELGAVEPAQLAAMQSRHFPASLWLDRHEEPMYLDTPL